VRLLIAIHIHVFVAYSVSRYLQCPFRRAWTYERRPCLHTSL